MVTGLVQGLFFVVGATFVLVGAAGVLLAVAATVQDRRSRRWPSVPGVVRRASVEERAVGRGTGHRARIVYEYEVGGRTYMSDRIAFSRSGSRKRAAADTAKYPPGTLVNVFYDPRRPERAILQKRAGLAGTLILLVVAAIFAGVGVGVVAVVLGLGIAPG